MRWWISIAFAMIPPKLCAAGPVEFGVAEFNAAVAARNLKVTPKIMAELNLEPPETFRIEPYIGGGAHITGGDLRGLMYGYLEAADQIRAAGKLSRVHGVPAISLRGVRVTVGQAILSPVDSEFWRSYFAMLARDRFNRVQIVVEGEPDAGGLRALRIISQTASEYGIDAAVGLRSVTDTALDQLLMECPAIHAVVLRSAPSAAQVGALLQVLRDSGRRVILELPFSENAPDSLTAAVGLGMPLRFFSQYGAAPSARPSDFYLEFEASQLGSDPESVAAMLISLGAGYEIASPAGEDGRPDASMIGIWGRLGYSEK